MIDFFVRPWEIFSHGKPIKIDGQYKTEQELRQRLYENIVDESLFISRASEGAVSAEWIMTQPIFIRKKYVKTFTEELKERERVLNKRKKS